MPSFIRSQTPFIPVAGRFVVTISRSVALAFTGSAPAALLRSFVVISCVAEGSCGAPLCFGPAGGSGTKALANRLSFAQAYPNTL